MDTTYMTNLLIRALVDAGIEEKQATQIVSTAKQLREIELNNNKRSTDIIRLLDHGPNKIMAIKIIRQLTGFDLKRAKEAVENTPWSYVCQSPAQATYYYEELTSAGCSVSYGE